MSSASPVISARANWILALLLAGVGATVTWLVVQARHPFFTVPEEYHITAMGAPMEAVEALTAQQRRADRLNAAVIFGISGMLLAVAVTSVVRCRLPLLTRWLVAVPLGGLWGALTGFAAASAYVRMMPDAQEPSVTNIALIQALGFALLGAGLGWLVGLLQSSLTASLRGLVLGVLLGGMGGFLYPLAAALALTSESTEHLIPLGRSVRLLWLGVPFLTLGCGLPGLLAEPTPPSSPKGTAD